MNVNNIKLQHLELLLPPDEDNHNLFCYALQIVFDIPEELGNAKTDPMTGIMFDVVNYDLIWRPDVDGAANYYQWLTSKTRERDPILSMYSFLFENSEPYYNERYEFSPKEKEIRKRFYEYLRTNYKNADEYIKRVADFLCVPINELPLSSETMNKKVWPKHN